MGTKEIGAIFIFSLADLTPSFESIHRTGNTGRTWTELYGDSASGEAIGDAGIAQIG